ncbi:MAG: pyridoxamine 5'-phosphate oxidase family protein [Oscillospiraceae bacterium]|nr:pyridoxamine 5'-phosphate oxidase family protein [Oscillospiraceae bacterium]
MTFSDTLVRAVMQQRFGHDTLLALATDANRIPYVRTVNAWYEDGCFYVITHAQSRKMQHIAQNAAVAVCGDWFSGHGIGEDLGHILAPSNAALAEKLRTVFAQWYTNGHTDESDPNTHILRIRLTDGILFDHGARYDITAG